MQRVSIIPRPGYLAIYDVKGESSSTIHVGSATDVRETTSGLNRLQTVEGNVSIKIKGYCNLYGSSADDPTIDMISCLLTSRLSVIQYGLHQDNWYINIFCQTWF